MVRRAALQKSLSLFVAVLVLTTPALLYGEGLSLLADLEYFNTTENRTDKSTGVVTDTESSRFSQLYQLDISRLVLPTLSVNLGGFIENEDLDSSLAVVNEEEVTSGTTQITVRPYVEVILTNPLYKAGLAYRTRDVETSSSFGVTENQAVQEYNAVFNWRPVDLPLVNLNYQRIELQEDPVTANVTRESLNLTSKYLYRDVSLDYTLVSQKNLDNLEDSGSRINSHNGRARFARGIDYKNNRFDVSAGAKLIFNNTEFINSGQIDTAASSAGSPFYISNDSPPTSNEPFDLTLVGGSNQLTNINIGRGGGLNPVSAGLGFGSPVEVETIYIQLSENTDTYPDLATPSQISSIAGSYTWRFYSSDDQTELNWTEQLISSVIYNSIDNRFEIRLAAPVNTRRVKVTTVPLTLVAPGEIRYSNIRALITLSGQAGEDPETFEQYYDAGLQWIPSARTTIGFNTYYRDREQQPLTSERISWVNSLFFRQTLNPIFYTYGRLSHEQRTSTQEQGTEDDTDLVYNLGLKATYLETLSQSLIYTGTDSSGSNGSSMTNSIVLRTDADLYEGWSMNLDLGYSFNSLSDEIDQKVKTLRFATTVEPNNRVDISLDYSITWTDETDQVSSTNQFGTAQILWSLTNTLNMFFRYNFRDQTGRSETSTYLREFNVNWAPFPDGTLQFSIGFNESRDIAEREVRAISPIVTWNIGRGIFLDLRYNIGTLESPVESSDIDSFIGKLRVFY